MNESFILFLQTTALSILGVAVVERFSSQSEGDDGGCR